jgi:hypothetical protein
MDIKGIGCGDMDSVDMVWDTVQWWPFINIFIINLQVP